MKTAVINVIILGVIAGLTSGSGLLPDEPLAAAVGGTVMFKTTLTPTETTFVVVAWQFNTFINIITSTTTDTIGPDFADRITLFRSTGSLELRNLDFSDSGEYSVTIVPDGGVQMTGITTLEVLEPVSQVTVTVSDTDLVEFNSSVSLSCSSSGSSLTFLWLNGSSEVTASDRVELTDGGQHLTIKNVTRYDRGPFRCRVSNAVSEVITDPLNLIISYGPENINLKTLPSEKFYKTGSDISFTCSAVSDPPAQFKWYLNRTQLSDTGPEFKLTNIQLNQSGDYSCEAFNTKTLRYQTSQPSAVTVVD